MGRKYCNPEGYNDSTACIAVGHVAWEEKQRLKQMCDSCSHRGYCAGAYKKDHWCGNYKGGR